VQKTRVTACRGIPEATGQQAEGRLEVTEVGPMPRHLLAVAEGWPAGGSTPVALERPGEDWRPVDPLVEGDVTGCLGNAAPVPPGPGRPTDTADARWRATRLRSGRRQARGLPPQGQGA
jgi:hypothetical protein